MGFKPCKCRESLMDKFDCALTPLTIDGVLPEHSRANVFSNVDAKNGFWHVELDDVSSRLKLSTHPLDDFVGVAFPSRVVQLQRASTPLLHTYIIGSSPQGFSE